MEREQSFSLKDLAVLFGGDVVGSPLREIARVGTPDECDSLSVVPLWGPFAFSQALSSAEMPALFTSSELLPEGFDAVVVENPRGCLSRLLKLFEPSLPHLEGIHPTAWVHPEAKVDPSAWVGPCCVVELGAEIGPESVLVAQNYLGPFARIGARVRLEAQVVLYGGVTVDRNVLIHSGSVLGAEGFGFEPQPGEPPLKIPQIGTVCIEEGVEIGAHVTVDRGTIGTTRIGAFSKLDDHVHVGHNVVIGKGCLLVAFAGVAGSSVLEDDVVLAARSGVAQHVRIGRGSRIAACGGATKDIPPETTVSGFPAWDHRKDLVAQGTLRRLPELAKTMKRMQKELEEIKRIMGS